MDNKSLEGESSASLKTYQQFDSGQKQTSNENTIDHEIDLKSITIEQDTLNAERLQISNVRNNDIKSSDGVPDTEQINKIKTESNPVPDHASRTNLEETNIETMKTPETMDLSINKIPKTSNLPTTDTLPAIDPETRTTTVTSDATHQETGIPSEIENLDTMYKLEGTHQDKWKQQETANSETMGTPETAYQKEKRSSDATHQETEIPSQAENLDTMLKLEGTDLDNRKQQETTYSETRGTQETAYQTEKRPSNATTDIFEDENPISKSVEPTSQNSSILTHNPVPGPSFAFEMNQFDSTHTTDRREENQPSSVILSPETAGRCNVLKRRHIPRNVEQEHEESTINTQIAEENDEWKKKPHFERRKMFNLAKHIISIVLIILDLVFDWVEYSEMNKTGNYTIAAERSVKNVEFTIECEGTGKTIQFIFLVFTIVATILSVIQILHIIYQMFHEIKGDMKDKKINLEYVETFVFLFFIEISQIMLIMGFYDVCTLDCTVDATEILIALNGLFSFFKLSWRFFTSCKCCTVYWNNPIRQRPVHRHPIRTGSLRHIDSRESPHLYRHHAQPQTNSPRQTQRNTDCCESCESCECNENTKTCLMIIMLPFLVLAIPFLPCILVYCIAKKCDCDVCDSKVDDAERAQHKWKCEQSCKCCILRCFPSRFPEQDTEACDCTCKQCLSCEKFCKCCFIRCFPTKLPIPKDDVIECKCGDCLRCERSCLCCFLRCCPTHLVPPKFEVCTCRCGDCIAFERPCKCFTFRCCPTHLNPPKNDIWNCTCRQCLACTMSFCPCFIFRCFPEFLKPSHPDICTCRCGECLSCHLPCKCFSFRCFPKHQKPPKSNWFECLCGDCMNCERDLCCCILRCFPSYAGENDFCTCILKQCLACQKSFACCLCRCFPSKLDPPKNDIFKCTCGKCLSCEKDCCCCIMRCCPSDLRPPENDWFECTCCKNCVSSQVQPAPMILQPHQQTPPTQRLLTPPLRIPIPQQKCTRGKCLSCENSCCCCIGQPQPVTPPTRPSLPPPISVITTQPIPQPRPVIIPQPRPVVSPQPRPVIIHQPRPVVIPQPTPIIIPQVPTPPPPKQRKHQCQNCRIKCINFLLAVFILLVLMLLLFHLFLLVVEIQFVFVCVEGEWLMLSTQKIFVQNYLKLFNV
ncbi:uncharacterized protein [Mytilus edulis]|uniref:uncharacterized protein n=1 Tax=Mytilus edulis TaxID=6550 RepID=UPI0039EF7167